MTKGVLLLLLVFLLLGASTQAAACEVRCDLGTRVPACHQAMAMASQTAPHVHMNNGNDAMPPRRAGSSFQKTCRMPQLLALCKTGQTYTGIIILPLLQGTVVTDDALKADGGAGLKIPSSRSTFHGPLAGQLRV